jgi:single-stranded DNA-binding protein
MRQARRRRRWRVSRNTNVCVFSGYLCKDAVVEIKKLRTGGEEEVACFRIGVNGPNDQKLFLNCELWRPGKVVEYLEEGKQVLVNGRLKSREFTNSDGAKDSWWSLDVRDLQLLGGARDTRRAEADVAEAF